MSYTINDLEKDISDINIELSDIRKAKGHDYSGEEDTFDNLRDFGSLGVAARMGDKYHRLKWFYQQGILAVENETVEDTIKDLINYAYFLLLLYRQEKSDG